ncbi:hypothetical protein [Odoribacter sp. Z80]|uniref:hypothetical protein n=1 Tax=Odoribacter sp. Z80 TaxID=2304575 RepID=UPI00137A1B82|nr:hypothetical protein [Odoribacter sp. Z80]NCE71333.1 hypothetical protein [Odoribacter sp. Z80]
MEKFKKLQEDIQDASNQEVVRKTAVSGVAVGILSAAIVCAIIGKMFDDPNSAVPTFLFTLAVFLFLGGIIKLFVSRSYYLHRPSRSRLQALTIYFDIHDGNDLQTCMEMKRFDELSRFKREKDTGVKLEAMIASKGDFAAVQISEYIPYTYEAVTPVMCFYGEDARALRASVGAVK